MAFRCMEMIPSFQILEACNAVQRSKATEEDNLEIFKKGERKRETKTRAEIEGETKRKREKKNGEIMKRDLMMLGGPARLLLAASQRGSWSQRS